MQKKQESKLKKLLRNVQKMRKFLKKHGKKTKKLSKKPSKKKLNKLKKFIIKLIIIEYIICAAFLIVSAFKYLIDSNQMKDNLISSQQATIKMLSDKITLNYKAAEVKEVTVDREYLGNFKITHYCACTKCCGANAQGITASGKRVEENKTIAVDPRVIKLGSKVYIEGYGEMEAQDTGSAIKGNIIDVYVADHQEALKLGVVYKDVYLLK